MKETVYDRFLQITIRFHQKSMNVLKTCLIILTFRRINSLFSLFPPLHLKFLHSSSGLNLKPTVFLQQSRSHNTIMDNYNGRQVSLSFFEPTELVQLIRKDGIDENYVILDVRDEDEYNDGHIIGAKNYPSGHWADYLFVREIIEKHVNKDTIVVHCFYSKQRGPTCARILADNMERYFLETPQEKVPKM